MSDSDNAIHLSDIFFHKKKIKLVFVWNTQPCKVFFYFVMLSVKLLVGAYNQKLNWVFTWLYCLSIQREQKNLSNYQNEPQANTYTLNKWKEMGTEWNEKHGKESILIGQCNFIWITNANSVSWIKGNKFDSLICSQMQF